MSAYIISLADVARFIDWRDRWARMWGQIARAALADGADKDGGK